MAASGSKAPCEAQWGRPWVLISSIARPINSSCATLRRWLMCCNRFCSPMALKAVIASARPLITPLCSSSLGLSASASKDDREMIISLVNPRYDLDMNVNCRIEDARLRQATAQILHDADYNACNTFDHPDRITLKDHPVHVTTAELQLDLPRLSVVTIRAARG